MQVIVTDQNQFRPSSFWFRTYLPKTLTSNSVFINNNPTIIYVTKNDAAILNNVDMERGTLWITTKDQIPKPEWDCEKNCISDLRLRYCNLMVILQSVQFINYSIFNL